MCFSKSKTAIGSSDYPYTVDFSLLTGYEVYPERGGCLLHQIEEWQKSFDHTYIINLI